MKVVQNQIQINNDTDIDTKVFQQAVEEHEVEQHKQQKLRLRYQILITAFILLSFAACIELFPAIKKSLYDSIASTHHNLGLGGQIFLFFFGVLMILIGLPFIFFEITLGYINKNYLSALMVVIPAKITGIFLCYYISKLFIQDGFNDQIKGNKFFKMLEQIKQKYPNRFLFIYTILYVPLFIKNYSLPLLGVTITEILTIFLPFKLILSLWYVYLGHTAVSYENMNTTYTEDILFALMFLSTFLLMFFLIRYTKQIETENSQEQQVIIQNKENQSHNATGEEDGYQDVKIKISDYRQNQ